MKLYRLIWNQHDDNAPEGTVYVCGACGKRASNRATGGISKGWDESCFMNAVLCETDSIELDSTGRVCKATRVERGEP